MQQMHTIALQCAQSCMEKSGVSHPGRLGIPVKKLCITNGTIEKLSKYFHKNILLLLNNSLINSHRKYSIGTWYWLFRNRPFL